VTKELDLTGIVARIMRDAENCRRLTAKKARSPSKSMSKRIASWAALRRSYERR
jgi:hypothetical protein